MILSWRESANRMRESRACHGGVSSHGKMVEGTGIICPGQGVEEEAYVDVGKEGRIKRQERMSLAENT